MHATQASVHRRCVDASNSSGARAAVAAARGIGRARSLFVNRRGGGITTRSAAVMWPSTLVRLARRGRTVECATRAIGVRCAATQGGNGAGGGDGGASVRWLGGTPQNGSNGGGANVPRGQPQAPPMRGQPQVPPPPSQGAPAVRSNGGQAGYNRPASAGNSARMAPAAATQKPGGAAAQSAVKSKNSNGQYFATPAPVVKRSKPEEEGEYAAPENTGPPGLRDAMMESGIVLQSYTPGQHRIICPTCNGGSTGERSLAVNIEDCGKRAQWMCHRANCEWTGGTDTSGRSRAPRGSDGAISNRRVAKPKLPAPEDLQRIGPGTMTPAAAKWAEMLKQRGISLETAERNGLAVQNLYSPASSGYVDALCFPYMRGGELINIKYRGPDKTFWQVKGAEKVLYGLDDIEGEEEVIIVEGEMDKLALEEAGFKNVVSVPDGAPGKVKDGPTPAPEEDKKYEYLWNCRAQLDSISRFVIATDSDGPGQALSEELARRLGKERCWRVTWPEDCKDANEALQKQGAEVVRECLTTAEGFPLRGLFRFSEFAPEIESYFNMSAANELRGVSSGWKNVDNHYRIVPGELTVVTGVPNSGKSEWVDALMCNLAVQHGWSFALCSLENKVHEHARKLVEKYVGEPWFEGKYSKAARMHPDTMRNGMRWLNEHFVLIRHEDDELPSVDWILGLARAAVLRHGIRGLLIDPYNELDHKRPHGQTETEYVSQMLTRIKRFAQHYDVHVWFVAHPRQLHNWKGEAPGLYDISGSAHFINKCDNGIVVHRNRDEKMGSLREVTINVQKVRNKVAGSIGDPKLEYNVSNGRYTDVV